MRAILDGKLLPVNSGAGWALQPGTAPVRREFRCPKELADALVDAGKAHQSKLTIDATDEGRGKITFNGLTILGSGPTDSPFENTVVVVDRRWELRYKHIHRRFNTPRRTGNMRRRGSQAPASQIITDDVGFAAYSLKDGKKRWTPDQVLTEVLNTLFGAGKWINRSVIGRTDLPDIEDLFLEGDGDSILGQLLADMGLAVDVFVNRTGKIVLFNKIDDTERRLVGAPEVGITTRQAAKVTPAITGNPYWATQDRKRERPKLVRVYFERLVEMRVDAVETGSAFPSASTVVPPPRMTNVLISPEDFNFQSREILVGQWIPVDFYLSYLSGKQPSGLPNLTRRVIRKGWMVNVLEAYSSPTLDPSGLWARRIETIRAHFRLSFQIQKEWRDRIRKIIPYRVAVEDFVTGARADAPVFADYAQFETWRARGTSLNNKPEPFDVVRNRFASKVSLRTPGAIVGVDYTRLNPAPARVQVIDEDQGIVQVQYGTFNDTSFNVSRFVRSAIDNGSMPSDLLNRRNLWLQEGMLDDAQQLSMIVTVSMGAPADNRRYHVEEITPTQAALKLPRRSVGRLSEGPVMEVKIQQALLPARFAWQDANAVAFALLYDTATSGPNGLPGATIQKVLGDPINKDRVREVALAAAARVYNSFLDRVEGGYTTVITPGMTLRGNAGAVRHEADQNQGAVTRVDLPANGPGIQLSALLPKSVRRAVEGLTDPKV
jgi:hypothetical protein